MSSVGEVSRLKRSHVLNQDLHLQTLITIFSNSAPGGG